MKTTKKEINFDLTTIAEGGLQEKVDRAVEEVLNNIQDPNTDAKKKRKVAVSIVFESNENRDSVGISTEVKTTLVPEIGVATTLLVGKDNKGELQANELKSGMQGQTYIDPDDGEVKTDTGTPVEEVEKAAGIIDFQKKQSKKA